MEIDAGFVAKLGDEIVIVEALTPRFVFNLVIVEVVERKSGNRNRSLMFTSISELNKYMRCAKDDLVVRGFTTTPLSRL